MQRVLGLGVHGEVERDPIQPVVAASQAAGEVSGVVRGGLHFGVVEVAVLGGVPAGRLEPFALLLELPSGGQGRDRFDVQ